MKRKILAFILSFIMISALVPTSSAADESFTINGTTVSQSSGTAVNNCSTYATQILKKIWTVNAVMTTYNSSYNLLKGKSAEERKLTEEHVKTYIQAAPLGSRIRICASNDIKTNNYDNSMQGHTMVLVAKDDSAETFTVLHAGWGSAATSTYTYSEFANHYIKQNGYHYFFYIADYSAAATNRKPDGGTSTEDGSNRTYTVTLDPNGGSVSPTAKSYPANSSIGELPTPTRSGYTFLGWSTAKEGSGMIVTPGSLLVQADTTLYASWKSETPQQNPTLNPSSFDQSGTFGSKNPFSWAFDSTTGTIVISGSGHMAGWQDAERRPWAKIRNSVTRVIVEDGAQNLSQYLVARCENMTNISIPESVVEIDDGTFIRAYSLENIQLPQGLTKIGGSAFSECTSLRSITIPENVNYIDAWAFSGCTNLQSIYFCGNAPSYFGNGGTSKLNMFSGCKNLTVYYPANSSGWGPIIQTYTDVTWKTWDVGGTASNNTPSTPTFGPWSEWSDIFYQASSTREVETRTVSNGSLTEYRYGRYVDNTGRNVCWCGKYLESLSHISGNASLHYSDWSQTRYDSNGKAWTCGYCNGDHIGIDHYDSAGRPAWLQYVLPNGESYYWEESRTTYGYTTQYRYRDLVS